MGISMRSRSIFLVAAALAGGRLHAQATTIRVSVDSQGDQANNPSYYAVISSNQRCIAFESYASDFVPGDANGFSDIYLLDRVTGEVERVSVSFSGGDAVGGNSESAAISADGRFVAFDSYASNLVPNDTNGNVDVFVRDRQAGTTERVSVDSSGNEVIEGSTSPAISADGRYVAFTSWSDSLVSGDTNKKWDIFVHDRNTGSTTRVSVDSAGSQGDGNSWDAMSISADGRFVAFYSLATNLVAGDTNGSGDVFVRDRSNGTTERVSISNTGAQASKGALFVRHSYMSADGRYVAFGSVSSDLVAGDVNATGDAFVRDRQAGTTVLVSVDSNGGQGDDITFSPSISADGRFVAFESLADNLVPNDTNGVIDVFVHDQVLGTTERANVDSRGSEDNGGGSDSPTLSDDGRFVLFWSYADNLVYGDTNGVADTFLHDRAPEGDTTRVSVDSSGAEADDDSSFPSLSGSGQIAAFQSAASNLVANDTNGVTDVLVRDRITGETDRVSVDSTGAEADGPSSNPSISSDGLTVAFESLADDLVAGDANAASDVFVRDGTTGITERASVDSSGGEGNGASRDASLSTDGRFCAFSSAASNLAANDTNGVDDVFVRDRLTGATERVSVDSAGAEADGASSRPALSADGSVVAFTSAATNLVAGSLPGKTAVYVHDRTTGKTELVSVDSSGVPANGDSRGAAISSDGRFVAFESDAANLVPGDTNGVTDVFVRDRATGSTLRASIDSIGAQANGASSRASISANGRFVTFSSAASNLVPADANGASDVFTRDLVTGLTRRESIDVSGTEGNGDSGLDRAVVSPDGSFVAFDSRAANLVSGDTNGRVDVFARDRRSIFATWWNYGAGFPGTNGIPTFTSEHDPVIGAPLTLDLANSSGVATVALLFVGFQQASIPSGWGGTLVVSPTLALMADLPAGGTTISGEIPNDDGLRGVVVDLQAIEGDAGALHGVSFTQGLELVLGHY